MNCKSIVFLAALAALILSAAAAFARVAFAPPPPVPERVAQSDLVVVGKVGKLEDKTVSAIPARGETNKVDWQVVAFQVQDTLSGNKELKEFRVGFLPPPVGGGVARPRPGFGITLTPGQEVGLFLTKHPTEDFYVATMNHQVFDPKAVNAERQLEAIRRSAKLLSDPLAGLKSKEAEDRLLTASMLVGRYRTDAAGTSKTESVDAELSKLILETIAEADWTPARMNPTLFSFQTGPQALFHKLGLTEKDGWSPPPNAANVNDLAKKWLKDNAATYRIQRFVGALEK